MRRCPACAADAALERALVDVTHPPPGAEGGAIWHRVANAAFAVTSGAAAIRAIDGRRALHGRILAATSLAAALILTGRLIWRPPGVMDAFGPDGVPSTGFWSDQRAARLDLRLWDAQPSAVDPMGPTTEGLLALLEGGS